MDPKHIPSKIIECAPVGPLSRYIEPYVTLHREQGYAPASLHEHVRVIVMFSQSLQRSGCEIRDLDEAVILFAFSPGRTFALSGDGEGLAAIHQQVPIRAVWCRHVEAL
jgi:hypothetical protein